MLDTDPSNPTGSAMTESSTKGGDEGATAEFHRVPVLDVHSGNFNNHVNRIKEDISASSFIAIDCELSGLGDRKKLNAPSIDERYKNTSLVAKTRSIISLGLSTFTLKKGLEPTSDEANDKSWAYSVSSYNIMVLCAEDYIVEPGSLRFLVEHGFDFEKQYSKGVSYLRGNDRDSKEAQPLRNLFSHLVQAKKAIVLHNGLIDLVFLYHNLYAALPPKLGSFLSDLSEMFPGGIYDTKYIADYVSRTQASFLEFVFRKEQHNNTEKYRKGRPHVRIRFNSWAEEPDIEWRYCGEQPDKSERGDVCLNYAHHGHCPKGNTCPLSHDIDQIIKHRGLEKKKSSKRKHPESANCDKEKTVVREVVSSDDRAAVPANSGGHRAGFDAFMTGFSFVTFLVHQTKMPRDPVNFLPASIQADKLVNRIYLVCKDFPMLVQKSAFSKSSGEHEKKMQKLSKEP